MKTGITTKSNTIKRNVVHLCDNTKFNRSDGYVVWPDSFCLSIRLVLITTSLRQQPQSPPPHFFSFSFCCMTLNFKCVFEWRDSYLKSSQRFLKISIHWPQFQWAMESHLYCIILNNFLPRRDVRCTTKMWKSLIVISRRYIQFRKYLILKTGCNISSNPLPKKSITGILCWKQ